MTLKKTEQLALLLMNKYGLIEKGWTFRFFKSYIDAGCCDYSEKAILVSERFPPVNYEDDIRDLILHEIAHVLAGHEAHHNDKWKKMCIKVGAKPERYFQGKTPAPNYVGTCPECGTENDYYYHPHTPRYCADCCKEYAGGKPVDTFKLIITKVK